MHLPAATRAARVDDRRECRIDEQVTDLDELVSPGRWHSDAISITVTGHAEDLPVRQLRE